MVGLGRAEWGWILGAPAPFPLLLILLSLDVIWSGAYWARVGCGNGVRIIFRGVLEGSAVGGRSHSDGHLCHEVDMEGV
jgi:hypothetical protein